MYEDDDDRLDDAADLDQQDLDDEGEESLTAEIAEALADKFELTIDDPSRDPEEFLEQLAAAIGAHPGWESVGAEDDEDDLDDDRPQRAALSSGRRVTTAQRGRELAKRQLQASGFFKPQPARTANLSHGRKATGGTVSAARGQAAADEIIANCSFLT